MIRTFALAASLVGAIACTKPHYLGAPMPPPCRAQDIDGCLGWMVERDLVAAELGVYEDRALRAYVQRVTDRIARVSLLDRSPRVLIADRDETYATVGSRIVVARSTLERVGSEAELAGVLAHELAHIEGKHTVAALYGPAPDEAWYELRRDIEAIADERAVVLLARAGYAPSAMARALRAVLVVEDDEHPARALRIARVEKLAGQNKPSGFDGRDEYLRAITGMVAGRDPRMGERVGNAWVIAALGIALPLAEADLVRAADELLVVRRGKATLTGYVIGAPWASELIATLDDREAGESKLGTVTAGTVPRRARDDDSPLGKLQRAIHGTRPQPAAGARVAIIERSRGALVLELGGKRTPQLQLRTATATELAATRPARIVIEAAPRGGTIAELDVCRGRLVDDPTRTVEIGAPIKCADRPVATPTQDPLADVLE